MPAFTQKLQPVLATVWRFPAKGLVLLLIGVVAWEGDLPKSGTLPVGYAAVLVLSVALLAFDRGFTLKVFAVLLVANLWVRDNYPLSHFPMYSTFSDHTFYVYVGGGDGEAIPLQTLTGIRTSKLKKPYDRRLDKERKRLKKRKRELTAEERRPAGEESLRQLYANSSVEARARLEAHSPLQLYHVDIYLKDGEVDERPAELIATLELPPQ